MLAVASEYVIIDKGGSARVKGRHCPTERETKTRSKELWSPRPPTETCDHSWHKWSPEHVLSAEDNKDDMLSTLHAKQMAPLKTILSEPPHHVTPEDAPPQMFAAAPPLSGAGQSRRPSGSGAWQGCSTRLSLEHRSNTNRDCSCGTERESSLQ